MNHTPEQQWSALSALYEEADALPAHALPAWLARLESARHPLLPQLRRMLEARAHLETDDFLGTLPRLSARAESSPGSDWSPGRRVGPYRLVRPLGEGGMAEVWLADRDDGVFKRQVAIKLPYPRPGRESFAARFDRERNILATLRHPHIAGLFDAGVTAEGQAWLALEYVEGQSISAFCDERRLPLRERVQLFRQVLLAVQHAHANLVIHRDLKPANILVTPQGEVRLLDFGIAKLLEAEGDAIAETELTRQAGRSMTPRYASPEQLTGLPLTTACDVYSLGVVFYELMCGERPYELRVDSPAQLEHAILEVEPRAPSRRPLSPASAEARGTTVKALHKALSPELDAIALRCLAKKPFGRYSSVDALLADVDRWLGGEAVLARAPGFWYRTRKLAARHKLGFGLGVTAIASLVAVASVAVALGMQAREESARAGAARDFMLSLFKRADQEKSRGADITARELLQSGRSDLLKRLAGQPRLQAELLMGIGTIQRDMGEYVDADSTFEDAVRLYSELNMPRQEVLARASHANVVLRLGQAQRAGVLLREAEDVADRPMADAELNARLKEVGGWIAHIEGDGARARDLFRQSKAYALKAFGPGHDRTLSAMRGMVYAERLLRNFDGALALQDELERAVARAGDKNPQEPAVLADTRAELLDAAGRFVDALSHIAATLPACVSEFGPNNESCRKLVLRKARVMLKLGMTQLSPQDDAFVEQLTQDAASPAMQIEATILLLRMESARGPSPRQQALFERLSDFGKPSAKLQINPPLRALAALVLAESQLRMGETAAARLRIDEVLRRLAAGETSLPAKAMLAYGKTLMGVSLLQGGDPDGGLRWLGQGQDEMSGVYGAQHPLTTLYSVNRAVALGALGRFQEANDVLSAAEPVLRRAMGASAPAYARVVRLRERLDHAQRSHDVGPLGSDFFS
ncbi:MAG TPA: serine/threonine-protein kinase [Albitalea sp.]|uniref:serine/threonine-protein kinase n=1 Tax=Piscinibacter sp. TaxID=1903157 RepID=UPI002ED0F585